MRERATDLLDEISAHDLVQPLASIKLQAEFAARRLRRGAGSVAEAVAVLDAIAERSGALADTLSAQLSNELGATSLRLTSCDLGDLVYTTLAGLDGFARDRIVILPNGRVEGRWDEERVAQVIRNLVGNALKYSDGEVRVSVGNREAHATLDVEDHGIGLNADELAHAFSPGYRSPRVIAQGASGVGLGLSGCRAIVEAHGGTISVESGGESRGARFHITLPLVAA